MRARRCVVVALDDSENGVILVRQVRPDYPNVGLLCLFPDPSHQLLGHFGLVLEAFLRRMGVDVHEMHVLPPYWSEWSRSKRVAGST